MKTTTVYVELLDEGVRVWKPVQAEVLGGGRYRLMPGMDYDETLETWEFLPGSIVRCQSRDFGSGPLEVAVECVPT